MMSTESQIHHEPPGPLMEALLMIRAEAAEMFLSLRSFFLVVTYGTLAGAVSYFGLWLDEKSEGKVSEQLSRLSDVSEEDRAQLIGNLQEQGLPTQVFEAVISGELPAFLAGVLYSSTFILPVLIMLVGFNRVSGDISSRFTRYVLQRVHRGSYLLGKIVGHWLVIFSSVVLVHCVLLVIGWSMEVFDIERITHAMPRIWLGMLLFSLVYVTYTQMLSTFLKPPIVVLLVGIMLILFIKIFTFILQFIYEPLGQIWIGDWDMRLWALDPIAVAVFLGYSGLFGGVSYLIFRRRDV